MRFAAVLSFVLLAAAPVRAVEGAADLQWVTDAGGSVVRDAAGRVTGLDFRASWVTDADMPNPGNMWKPVDIDSLSEAERARVPSRWW